MKCTPTSISIVLGVVAGNVGCICSIITPIECKVGEHQSAAACRQLGKSGCSLYLIKFVMLPRQHQLASTVQPTGIGGTFA